jgi:hypothetical protein
MRCSVYRRRISTFWRASLHDVARTVIERDFAIGAGVIKYINALKAL